MSTQEITIERRQYSRGGVIGQLEDITYAALRKYGVIEEGRSEVSNSPDQGSTTIQ
jgi:hypothetical protein